MGLRRGKTDGEEVDGQRDRQADFRLSISLSVALPPRHDTTRSHDAHHRHNHHYNKKRKNATTGQEPKHQLLRGGLVPEQEQEYVSRSRPSPPPTIIPHRRHARAADCAVSLTRMPSSHKRTYIRSQMDGRDEIARHGTMWCGRFSALSLFRARLIVIACVWFICNLPTASIAVMGSWVRANGRKEHEMGSGSAVAALCAL
ncbi:hypothetical protein BKA80DRAFT_134927 [Phyllosticta citrichinensis]